MYEYLRPFSKKFHASRMAQTRFFLIILFVNLALAGFVSQKVIADPVSDLTSVFGNPSDFVASFKAQVKDRSDQVVGLLIAASGFVYAIKVFTN